MSNLPSHAQREAEFRKRIEVDGLAFCTELFEYQTVRLLAMKYAYYILNELIAKDVTYDLSEKTWFVMGRALDLLAEDETSPCIDFNYGHPLAKEAIELANKLPKMRLSRGQRRNHESDSEQDSEFEDV